jgi:hypothetical protein
VGKYEQKVFTTIRKYLFYDILIHTD